jgi:hypothetical protein
MEKLMFVCSIVAIISRPRQASRGVLSQFCANICLTHAAPSESTWRCSYVGRVMPVPQAVFELRNDAANAKASTGTTGDRRFTPIAIHKTRPRINL